MLKSRMGKGSALPLDHKLLVEFLSRPRKISEVAARFAIPVEEAERLVLRSVESGEVLLTASPGRRAFFSVATLTHLESNRESIIAKQPAGKSSKLPSAQMHRVQSNLSLEPYRGSMLKIEKGGPIALHRKLQPVVISTTIRRKGVENTSSLSISRKVLFYEALLKGPKTLTELRACAETSRGLLNTSLRNGLVDSSWGSKGVGVLFKITEKGIGELERLRAATHAASGLTKKTLMSSRTVAIR